MIRVRAYLFVAVLVAAGAAVGLAGTASAGHGGGTTIVVDDDFTTTNASHKATIQAAVDAASTGDTISVRNGTYGGSVVVDTSGLTIVGAPGTKRGAAPDAPVLDNSSGLVRHGFNAAFYVEDGASNVTIAGFDVRNYEYGVIVDAAGSFGESVREIHDVTVRSNEMSNVDFGLLAFAEGEAGKLSDISVKNNVINARGLSFYAPNEGTIDGVSVRNNTISASTEGNGITFSASHLAYPSLGFGDAGSGAETIRNVVVANNDVDLGSPPGQRPGARDTVQLVFHHSGVGRNLTFRNNELSGTSTGFLLEGNGTYEDVDLVRNHVFNANQAVKTRPAGGNQQGPTNVSGVTLAYNHLEAGVVHPPGAEGVLNATRNYWGAPSGPSGAYDGYGASVSGDVSAKPYYVSPAMTTLSTEANRTADIVVDDRVADFATIQAAVDAAEPGDTIVVRAGTYEENVTITTDNLTIRGAGAHATTIVGQVIVPSEAANLPVGSVTGLELRGFRVVPAGAENTADVEKAALDIQTGGRSDAPQSNLTFTNNTFLAPGTGYAVFHGGNTEHVTYENNTFGVYGNNTATKLVFVGGERSYGAARASVDVDFTNNEFAGGVEVVSAGAAAALEHEAAHSRLTNNDFSAVSTGEGVVTGDPATSIPFYGSTDLAAAVYATGTTLSSTQGLAVTSETAASNAIQPVVDFVESGATVHVSAGTYATSVSVGTSNVTVAGPNAGTPGAATRGPEAVVEGTVTLSAPNVTLDGLTVRPASGKAVALNGADYVVRNSVLNASSGAVAANGTADGGRLANNSIVAGATSNYGVRIGDAVGVDVVDNSFRQAAPASGGTTPQGLLLNSTTAAVVRDNVFRGAGGGQAIRVSNNAGNTSALTIRGNDVADYGTGVFLYENAAAIDDVTVTRNEVTGETGFAVRAVEDSGTDGFTDLAGADSAGVQAVSIVRANNVSSVSVNGTVATTGPITVDDDGTAHFSTIQAAVDAASTGDTVRVSPGTYTQGFDVTTRGVRVIAPGGPSETTIDFSGSGPAVEVLASNVTVAGFEITNVSGDWESGQGLSVSNNAGANLRNVTVRDLNIHHVGDKGLVVDFSTGTRIVDVRVHHNPDDEGITVWKANGTTIRDAVVYANGGSGAPGESDPGIFVNGDDTTLRNVTAYNNSDYGVAVNNKDGWEYGGTQGVSLTVVNSTFHDNPKGGLGVFHNEQAVTVTESRFLGSEGVTVDAASTPVTATHNYWGAASGPGGAYGGLGANVTANVTVAPYYVDAAMTTLSTASGATDYIVDGDGPSDFDTIAAAVSAASSGDTIEVRAGRYPGPITVDVDNLTIRGAGDGAGAASNTVIEGAGSGTGVTVGADDVTITGVNVTNWHTAVRLQSVSDVTLDGVSLSANANTGLDVPTAVNVNGLTIRDSHLDHNEFGVYIASNWQNPSGPNTTVTDVVIADTTLSHNSGKGIYAEKLEHARLANLTVVRSGVGANPTPGPYPNNGIDINLKNGDYENVTVVDSTFRSAGLRHAANAGADLSGALVIKARDDGAYSGVAGSLTDVAVRNNTFVGSGPNATVALRFGEPGAGNAGPTGVTVAENSFSGYDRPVWDATDSPVDVSAVVAANSFDRRVVVRNATSGAHRPIVWTSIQAALNASAAGDTVTVSAGTYTGDVDVGAANLTLRAAPGARPVITSPDGPVLQINAPNVTVEGFVITGADGRNEAGQGVDVNGDAHDTDGVTLRDLVVRDNDDRGIVVDYTDNATIVGVRVADNYDPANDGDTPEDGWESAGDADGITIWYSNHTVIRNVRAINNSDNGVYVNGYDTTVVNLTAVNNGDEGLDVSLERIAGGGATVRDLTARNNSAQAVEVEGNGAPVTITDSVLAGSPQGLNVRANSAANVTVTDSAFRNNTVHVTSAAGLDTRRILRENTFDEYAVVRNGTTGALRGSVWGSIAPAVGAATANDTVRLSAGEFEPENSISLEAPISVVGAGQGATTVDATGLPRAFAVRSDGVLLAGLTVANPGVNLDDGSEVEGIFVGDPSGFTDTGERIVIADVTVEHVRPAAPGKTVEGIHAKGYDSGDDVTGLVVENVTVADVVHPSSGADGLKIQAAVRDVDVDEVTVRDVRGTWAYGVVLTPSARESGVPTGVTVFETRIANVTASTYDGVGLGVDVAEGTAADAGAVTVRQSTFATNDVAVLNKDRDATVDAIRNYWGSPGGPTAGDTNGSVATAPALSVPAIGGPVAAVSAPDSVAAGTSVTFDATGSAPGPLLATYEWTFPNGTATGQTVTHAFDEPGTYDVTLTVTDDDGVQASTTVTITVTEQDAGDDGDTGDGGDTGDTGDGDTGDTGDGDTDDGDTGDGDTGDTGDGDTGDGDAAPPTNESTVNVSVAQNGTVTATGNATPTDPVTVDVPENAGQTSNGSVELNQLNVSVSESTTVQVQASVSTTPPSGTPAAGEGTEAYLSVETDTGDATVETATFTFSLAADRVGDPSNVVLSRYNDGSWNDLETTHLGTSDGRHRFRARSPGFSVFAIQEVDPASVSVIDASLGRTQVEVGATVEVTATLANDGGRDGERTVPLVVDGQNVTTRTVSVPAGEERTVTLSYTPDETGDHDVAVGDASAGTLTVTVETTTAETTTAGTTTAETTTAGTTTAETTTAETTTAGTTAATTERPETRTRTADRTATRTDTAAGPTATATEGDRTTTPTATTLAEPSGLPGFTVGIALVAVLAAALLALRRR